MGLFSTIREEWPVIKQAPATITLTVLILTAAATAAIYAGFHENLARKDDLINTLRNQLDSKPHEKPGSSPKPSEPGQSGGDCTANVDGNGNHTSVNCNEQNPK